MRVVGVVAVRHRLVTAARAVLVTVLAVRAVVHGVRLSSTALQARHPGRTRTKSNADGVTGQVVI
ncbi:hypothetical protein GCM10009738_68330 [Kitasatospora viridis]